MTQALSPFALLLALASGAVVGALLGLLGGGGSIRSTPLSRYVVGIRDRHVAIGASAAAVSVDTAVGLLGHARQGGVKWPCATVFASAGPAGAAGRRLCGLAGERRSGMIAAGWTALARLGRIGQKE